MRLDADRLQVMARVSGGSASTSKTSATTAISYASTLPHERTPHRGSDTTILRYTGAGMIEDQDKHVHVCTGIVMIRMIGASKRSEHTLTLLA